MAFEISDKLKALGNEVINTFEEFKHLKELNVKYLISDKPKKNGNKVVYADCTKVNDKNKAVSGVDFIITFYADSAGIGEECLKILMRHELMHIGYDGKKRYIVPHDCEDFKAIIRDYGVDWINS